MKMTYLTSKGEPVKISHFPGWTRYKYKYLMDKFSTNKIGGLPKDLRIITCVDDDSASHGKSPLINQLDRCGIPYINAAEHKDVYPWVNNKKIHLLYDTLKNVKSKYCLILDGIDVTINENLDDIIDIFNTYKKDIVFNATPWAHPHAEIDIIENRKELYGKYCYLNAGCCIGKTKALVKFYKEVAEIFDNTPETDENWESEQYFVRKAFANHMDKVWFDNECKLFQVWHKTKLSLPHIDRITGDITYTIVDDEDKNNED